MHLNTNTLIWLLYWSMFDMVRSSKKPTEFLENKLVNKTKCDSRYFLMEEIQMYNKFQMVEI